MDFSTETLQAMTEVGFLGSVNGLPGPAIVIFEGIVAARPDSEFPQIGRSFAHLCSGNPNEATRILVEEALQKNPDSSIAQAFVGLCLKQAGMNSEADGVLEEVAEGEDETAKAMAAALLQESFSQ